MKKSNFGGVGFTLIELIIVMTILGVLASVFILNFPSAQKRARDSQRRGDIKQYQTSLEVFANKSTGNVYPTPSGNMTSHCATLGLPTCPDDPKAPPSYRYETDASGIGYYIWATLEQPDVTGSIVYFVVCSNGVSGETTTAPAGASCPI